MTSAFGSHFAEQTNRAAAVSVSQVPARSIRHWAVWFLSCFLAASAISRAQADELQDYSQQCDAAIGTTVQDFDCDAGTDVPVTHYNGSTCDRPNRLNGVCDPGSRFQVLTRSEDAYVVAHCRKKGNPSGQYGDIAVIQYNRKNGATCFYQALGIGLPGQVKAPSRGQSAWLWWLPSATAGIGCGECHDNGPFIRSPYLNQVTGPNSLPGADDFRFNSNQPYAFVGKDFTSWKAFKVEVSGNECISCHRLGVNNIKPGYGTALDFAIRATAASEPSKNPPSLDSPIWMPPVPVQTAFNQVHADAARAIHDCAERLHENPNTDSCRTTPFAGAYQPRGTADIVWQHSNGQVHYWPMKNGQRMGGIDIFTPVGSEWTLRGVGDVDGDGTADIVWQHSNGQVHYWPMKNGQRMGGIDIFTPVGGEWTLRGVGDVDGS